MSVGIRVPECALRSFAPEEHPKKYYHEYECNLRWTLGEKSKKKTGEYNLRMPIATIIEDLLMRLNTAVLPMFDMLSSREAILARQEEYPQFNAGRLILLDNAMIYGRRGDTAKAAELFNEHYRTGGDEAYARRYPEVHRAHQASLRELAANLGIEINDNIPEA